MIEFVDLKKKKVYFCLLIIFSSGANINFNNINMKKVFFGVCTVMLICTFSCTGNRPSKTLFNDKVDSVSYSIGMSRTHGFMEYLINQMGVDTTYLDAFVKGFYEGASLAGDESKRAYIAGLQIGYAELGQSFVEIGKSMFGEDASISMNSSNYINAFIDGVYGNYSVMSSTQADSVSDLYYNYFVSERMNRLYGDNMKAGEDFLAKKALESDIVVLESGLMYKVLEKGKGAIPAPTDKVKVLYEGSLIDGTIFESSPSAIELRVNGVIQGWQEALSIMPVGSKWEIYIPHYLAYGDQENASSIIKPYSTLVFKIELLSISK